jgi:lysophospholipase L1-like esterase
MRGFHGHLPAMSSYIRAAAGITSPYRLQCIGDSITAGSGDLTNGGYRKQLDADLTTDGRPPDMVGSLADGSFGDNQHNGLSGAFTLDLLTKMWAWLEYGNPHIVLLQIGTNDCATAYDLPNLPARVGTLLDMVHMFNPRTWVSVSDLTPLTDATYNARVNTFNAALPAVVATRVAAGRRAHFSQSGSAVSPGNLSDGVHPNATGYAQKATVLRADVNVILNAWV